MKDLIHERAVLCLALLLTAPLPAFRASATPPAGYYLVWNDEFNGASLDTTKWDYWLLGHRRDAVNVVNAVSVGGGYLTITTYTSNNVHYTGMIATDQTFRSRFGYYESSIRWGDTNGMWSAFWMQSPTMGTYLNDPFVSGSEIDIVEHRYVDSATNNISNYVQNNIHWNGYGSGARSAGSGNIGSGLATGFHTYGFLWTPSLYTLYVDGANLRSWSYANNGVPISLSTEWVILSSEVDDTSTTWAGYIPPGGYGSLSASTTKLTVDYVRYYAPTNILFWTGTGSAYWTNSANWVANVQPGPASDVTFSMLSANLNPVLGQDYSVDSLVFLNLKNGISLNGPNILTLGAGGIDMLAANHTVTINAPLKIGAAQTWYVGPNNPGNTLIVNGNVSGTNTWTKASYGTVVLKGTNSFSGTLNVDTSSTYTNDGCLRIANSAAVSGVASPIAIRNNNSGSSTLQLDGSAGNLAVPQAIALNGRNVAVPAIENLAGSNTMAGNLTVNVGGSFYLLQCDAGTLAFAGAISSVATGARTFTFQGNGDFVVSGPIQNGSATVCVSKTNSGTLNLAGTNTYTGPTTVNGGTLRVNGSLGSGAVTVASGTLGGTGTINGLVTIQSAATLSPGGSGGTLTISNTLSLGGVTFMELNKAAGTSDCVRGLTSVSYGGTLLVTNLSGVLAGGDAFTLFSAASSSGSFSVTNLPPLGVGLAWRFDGASGILRVLSTTRTNLTACLFGSTLALSWPQDHTGWSLQMQTNGLSTNWFDVPAAQTTNRLFLPIDAANGSAFYRMILR